MSKDKHLSRIDQAIKWTEERIDDENFAGYAGEFSTARIEILEEVLEVLGVLQDDEK